MAQDDRLRLQKLIRTRAGDPLADTTAAGPWLDSLCHVAVDELGVDAVAVSAGPDVRGDFAVVAASGPQARHCAEAEFTAGSGPSHDASGGRRPVIVRDVEAEAAAWPGLAAEVDGFAMRAVLVFPLQLGAIRMGVLAAYAQEPCVVTAAQVGSGLLLAHEASLTMLERGTPERRGPTLAARLDSATDLRSEVYQAQGLLAAGLGVGLADSLAVLRAYAFENDRTIADVAREVLRGDLDLHELGYGPRNGEDRDHENRDQP